MPALANMLPECMGHCRPALVGPSVGAPIRLDNILTPIPPSMVATRTSEIQFVVKNRGGSVLREDNRMDSRPVARVPAGNMPRNRRRMRTCSETFTILEFVRGDWDASTVFQHVPSHGLRRRTKNKVAVEALVL